MFYLKTMIFIDVLMIVALVLFRQALVPRYRHLVSGKLVTLALVTPAVALFSHSLYLVCLYLVAVIAFNSRSRVELAGTLLFVLPLAPILVVETGVGGIYLIGVSTVLAMGLGALIAFLITGAGSARLGPTLPRYDLALWIIVASFMFIYNRDPTLTGLLRGLTTNMLSFAGPFLLLSRAARSRRDVESMLLRLCLGGTIVAVTACFQARWHWVVFETYYTALHVRLPDLSANLSMRAGLLRTGGSMVDYSAGGLFLSTILTLIPLLRHCFSRLGFWFIMIVLLGGLIATQSRGAWVATIFGFAFVTAYRGQWIRMVLLAGSAVAAEVLILVFAKSGRLAEIAGQTDEASGTVDYRHRLLSRGLEQIQAHPLFGQSQEQLIANLPDLRQGQHIVDFVNGHLFIAMAGGIPLFVVWCCVWLMPIVDGWRQRGPDAILAAAPAAITVPAMIALIFTSFIDRNLTWPTIALALAPACLMFDKRRGVRRPGGLGPNKPSPYR